MPSSGIAPNVLSKISEMVNMSDFLTDNVVQGRLIAPGIMPFSAQSGVLESIKSPSISPKLIFSSSDSNSSSPMVSTPGARSMGWMQNGGHGLEVSA